MKKETEYKIGGIAVTAMLIFALGTIIVYAGVVDPVGLMMLTVAGICTMLGFIFYMSEWIRKIKHKEI